MHPAMDLIRNDRQRIEPHVFLNQILLEFRTNQFLECIDYSQIGFASQAHCYEDCVLNRYTSKYRSLPSWVSYEPQRHPSDWGSLKFDDQRDASIERTCDQSICSRSDCNVIRFRPSFFGDSAISFIRIPKTTYLIESRQSAKMSWLEFVLQLISLASFCLKFSARQTLFCLLRRWMNFKLTFILRCLLLILFLLIIRRLCLIHLTHTLISNTEFHVDTTDHLPDLFICWSHEDEIQFGLKNILQTLTVIVPILNGPNSAKFKFNKSDDHHDLHSWQLNRLPHLNCLQFRLSKEVRLTPNVHFLYAINFKNTNLTIHTFVGTRDTYMPNVLLNRPCSFSYIRLQTIYQDDHLCTQYPRPRWQMYRQLLNDNMEQLIIRNQTHDLKKWLHFVHHTLNQFEQDHPKPDCVAEDFLPMLNNDLTLLANAVKQLFIVRLSKTLVKLTYSDNFSPSRYAIFLLSSLEITLNITFNQSLLILFLHLHQLIQRVMMKKKVCTIFQNHL